MTQIGMQEAKTNLSQLVERALAGEEIVLTRRGVPAVTLEPVKAKIPFREMRGALKGNTDRPFPTDEEWKQMDKEIEEEFNSSKIWPDE